MIHVSHFMTNAGKFTNRQLQVGQHITEKPFCFAFNFIKSIVY